MNPPRPESRLSELESQMGLHGARIRELSDDTAESLRDLKQDIKQLSESITDSYKQIGDFFVLFDKDAEMIKATMATKEDISKLEARFDTLEARFDRIETTHGDLLRQILLRLPPEPQQDQ